MPQILSLMKSQLITVKFKFCFAAFEPLSHLPEILLFGIKPTMSLTHHFISTKSCEER